MIKCELLNTEIIDYIKNKVFETLEMNKTTNVVRNLHDISTWTELNDLWNGIENFCLLNFPVAMKNMYFSHKTYGGVMISNAPLNVKDHQKWHRDTEYKSYTICIPLVPVHEKNGCTQILPNTLEVLPRSWRKYYSHSMNLECDLGNIIIFDGRILHRGLKNNTQLNRPILIGTMSAHGFTNDFELQ
jgi:ectoine hydroxylase-related dioxygenase (phytanoyl-CoA dioxygenase family)